MQARLEGLLELGPDCAYLNRGTDRIPLIFSGDARVDRSTGLAVVFERARLRHGERVSLGGGFVDRSEFPVLARQVSPPSCPGRYFLVQSVE